jgi:hypothetical protein
VRSAAVVPPPVRRLGPPEPRAAAVVPLPASTRAREVAPLARAAAKGVAPLRAVPRRVARLRRPAVHGGRGAGPRTQRRARVPWGALPRERLATAWDRVRAEAGPGAADLRLVGVFGPLPLGAVEDVVLEQDGRLAVTLARRPPGPAGDLVLARHGERGALVRSDVPSTARFGGSRDLR